MNMLSKAKFREAGMITRRHDMILRVRKFGFAVGMTFALVYLGCVFVMATVSTETAVTFFNRLIHGINVTPLLRTEMPLWEMGIGIIEVFILGWLIGATVASIYNLGSRSLP